MSYPSELPTKVGENRILGEEFEHPAFGVITVTKWQGSGKNRLFGSDLSHNSGVSVSIHLAKECRRHYESYPHAKGRLVEFDLTHAQWAKFISSFGDGSGTPITLKAYPDGNAISRPEISAPTETVPERMERELAASVRGEILKMRQTVADLRAMVDDKRLSLKEVRQLVRDLEIELGNLPVNVGFSVEQAKRYTEELVSDAKLEVESHMRTLASELGMKQLGNQISQETKNVDPNLDADPIVGWVASEGSAN